MTVRSPDGAPVMVLTSQEPRGHGVPVEVEVPIHDSSYLTRWIEERGQGEPASGEERKAILDAAAATLVDEHAENLRWTELVVDDRDFNAAHDRVRRRLAWDEPTTGRVAIVASRDACPHNQPEGSWGATMHGGQIYVVRAAETEAPNRYRAVTARRNRRGLLVDPLGLRGQVPVERRRWSCCDEGHPAEGVAAAFETQQEHRPPGGWRG